MKPIMSERSLATIRKIKEILPIKNADAIELVVIDGWQAVAKKDQFTIGQHVLYLEIDSWVPTTLAPFLTKTGHEPKEYNGIQGERLRTIKLRGELSQGLVLPIPGGLLSYGDEYDCTEELGIQKWEKPLPANLTGCAKGSFPSFIPKTDQNRIQNMGRQLDNWIGDGSLWEVTEKLDGSSMTVYYKDGVVGVCSHNIDLKRDENNTFWKVAIEAGLVKKILEYGMELALQGELIGPGIQGNQYGLGQHEFMLFDIVDINKQEYLNHEERIRICTELELQHVPVIEVLGLGTSPVTAFLSYATGDSELNGSIREGIVLKNTSDPSRSFKVINNDWLLKNE